MNTNLLHDILFARIFEKETILICGPGEELDQHTLIKLFSASSTKSRCLKHALFLDPGLSTSNYLEGSPLQLDNDYYYPKNDEELIRQLSPMAVNSKNIIVCGFPQWPNDQLSRILSRVNRDPENPFLFFTSPSSEENKKYWVEEKNAYIEPSGIGLNGYIHRISTDSIFFDQAIKDFEEDHELDLRSIQRQDFLKIKEKTNKYLVQIKGISGVGKHTFVKELKFQKAIGKSLTIELYQDINYESFLVKIGQKLKLFFDLSVDNIIQFEESYFEAFESIEQYFDCNTLFK